MISAGSIAAYAGGILLVALILYFKTKPIRWIIKMILNGVLGGVMLYVINYMGAKIGLNIPINPINSLVAGVLGFPGVILLIILQLVL